MNKRLQRVLGILCLCSVLGIVALRQYYTRYRPEMPQPEFGRTVKIDANYGKTVFVTPTEKRIRDFVDASPLLPIAVGAFYLLILVVKSASEK